MSTTLLMHFDGESGSTTFTDLTGHTANAFGNPIISSNSSRFGGSSLYLDGASFLRFPSSPDWDLNSKDFTIELWASPFSNNGFQGFLSTWANWAVHYTSGQMYFQTLDQTIGAAVDLTVGWHHIAVSCKDNVIRIFVDGGLLIFSDLTTPLDNQEIPLDIGSINGGNLAGFIDEIRMIKGAGLYGSNFTPLQEAFPDQIVTPVDLTPYFDILGVTTNGTVYTGGLDVNVGSSSTLSSNLIGTFQNCDAVPFMIGKENELNAISSQNTVITIPTGYYDAISILALTFNGNKDGNFIITYTNLSAELIVQTIESWTEQGEIENKESSIEMGYINNPDGGQSVVPVYLTRYEFPTNSNTPIVSLTLPNVPNICVFAVTGILNIVPELFVYDEIGSGGIIIAGDGIDSMAIDIYNETGTGGVELAGDSTEINHFVGFVCKSNNTYQGVRGRYVKTKKASNKQAYLAAITICNQGVVIVDDHLLN